MPYTLSHVQVGADYVRRRIGFAPEIGIILGTGLNHLADEIEERVEIPYGDIPNFLTATAPSHRGRLVLGRLSGRFVACMAGRFHYYEGYDFEELTAPVHLLKLLGVKAALLTNAAGSVNLSYQPGDVMVIKDHINLVGASPLRGKNADELGPRFFDMGSVYSKDLRALALRLAKDSPLAVHEGVYMFFAGPHFETHAEIRAARVLGADAAGMSTITEAITAAHCALPVLGLSLITNYGAGILEQPLDGAEVDITAARVAKPFSDYVKAILKNMEV